MARSPLPAKLAPAAITGLSLAFASVLCAMPGVRAASALLESVKQNPELARELCREFKALNAEGRSATSKESLARVRLRLGLSQDQDAEVVTTYVIGLHCPDVR